MSSKPFVFLATASSRILLLMNMPIIPEAAGATHVMSLAAAECGFGPQIMPGRFDSSILDMVDAK